MVFSCCIYNIGSAQSISFNEYRKQKQAEFQQYKEQSQADFDRYRKQCNEEFKVFLSQKWKELNIQKGILPPEMPKPFVPHPDDNTPTKPVRSKQFLIEKIVMPTPVPKPIPPILISPPQEVVPKKEYLKVNFYGIDIYIRRANLDHIELNTNNPTDISSAWEKISQMVIDPLIYDCQKVRNDYKFCDWAYYQFLKQVSKSLFNGDKSNINMLFVGYVLAHSNMDFRFVRCENHLLLAFPCNNKVYRTLHFKLNGINYYLAEAANITNAYIMPHSFGKKAIPFNLNISRAMILPADTKTKVRTLRAKGYPLLKITVSSSLALMNFYNDYPRVDWDLYANTDLEIGTAKNVLEVFNRAIKGKNEKDAINMILNFVQTAFTYGYDDEIWGQDRPFFPDETLNYPYSDCEDRAILFSYLVRKLTKLDVVLLHYPNHLATAVKFNIPLQGDYVMIDGVKYLVCDPTGYKPIGNAYEQFKHIAAEVIKL